MKMVFLLCEGQTEEVFVRRVLEPHLNVPLRPIIVTTRRGGASPRKGGSVAYANFRQQVMELLRGRLATLVTTLMDYQGLNHDFPGRQGRTEPSAMKRAEALEAALRQDIRDPRYEPFVFMHEFEALLLTRPEVIAEVVRQPRLAQALRDIRHDKRQYEETPEEINESPATSPSARIAGICGIESGKSVFQKVAHGVLVAQRIGLTEIRAQCPHFDSWLRKLEAHATA
jgi:hypothetical protein